MRPPIINRKDLLNFSNRAVTGTLTVVFWLFWVYLWVPLLALLAWAAGVEQAYKYMVVLGGWQEVVRLLSFYTLIIVLMGGSLCAWAAYNILRYGNRQRRSGGAIPTASQIAGYFNHSEIAIDTWRAAQRLYATHDEKGSLVKVAILAPGTPVPGTPTPVTAEVPPPIVGLKRAA